MASTASTNLDLAAAAERGDVVSATALMADHQTAGRGRMDRRWDAPPGANLLVSLLFVDVPERPVTLTHRVGVAAVRAVETLQRERVAERPSHDHVAADLGLKWPNDVLLDGRKLAGILAQRTSRSVDGTRRDVVVVGIGVNVAWAPEGAASLVADLALDVSPRRLLDALLDELDALAAVPDEELDHEYRRRLLTLGRRVRVELPGDRSRTGVAADVDAHGRLVVAPDDGGPLETFDVGDIVHLRDASR